MRVKEKSEKSWLKSHHSKNKDHGIWSHHFMANRWGNSDRLYFLRVQNHCTWWLQPEIKRHLLLGRKAMTNLGCQVPFRPPIPNVGLLLRRCSGKGLHLAMTGATWFFSSVGGILELRRGIQDASCVGPGKSNLPFELRRKAGDCSRVTAGPIDLI